MYGVKEVSGLAHMKKIFLIILLVLALMLAAVIAWLRYGSGAWIAGQIAEYSRQYTGSNITLQQTPATRIFPPALVLGGLSWESPDKSYLVSIRSLNIKPDSLSLLLGRLNLSEILLEGINIKINLQQEVVKDSSPANPKAQNSKVESSRGLPFEIGRLIAQKGTVEIFSGNAHVLLDKVNFTADELRNRQEARLAGDFVLSVFSAGEAEADAWLAGNLAFRAKARFYAPNLTLRQTTVTFTATRGEALGWMSPLQLVLDAAINLDSLDLKATQASLSSAQGKLGFSGNVNFKQENASGQCTLAVDLPKILGQATDATFADDESLLVIHSPIEFANSVISLSEIAVKSGVSEGSGKLTFRLPEVGASAALSGNLAFRRLALWSNQTRGKDKAQSESKGNIRGSATPYRLFPQLDLRLAADDFQYGSFRAKKLRASLQGAEGIYALKDGAMQWADGAIEASATGNFSEGSFEVKARGENINAGLGLQESGFKGFSGGEANFRADLFTKGLDIESLRSTLSGKASFGVNEVKINLLENLSKFLPAGAAKKYFPDAVQLFTVEMRAKNGNLNIDSLKLEAKSLEATGTAQYSPTLGKIDGKLDLKVGPISLPLAFSGPANDISWSVTGGFFRNLLRDLP